MPPKATVGPEEDVQFLLTVIKQMSGAIDWQKVTDDLSLPSKGAAAKRFSRMPGKYGIEKGSNTTPDAEHAPKTPKKTGAKAAAKKTTASAKKRKVAEAEEDVEEDVKAEVEED